MHVMDNRYTLFPPLVVTKATTTTTAATPTPSATDSVRATAVYLDEVAGRPIWNTVDGWSVALLVLTTVRLVLTLCLWTYLTYGTVRARTRLAVVWPHQLLLLVLTMSHAVLYAFALTPTVVVCAVLRLGLGLGYVLMLAVLVLKLIVIAANDKGYEVPRVGQILLLLLVCGVQLGLGLQWVILVPPEVVGQWPSASCNTSVAEWLGHLSYVDILLLASVFLALTVHDVKADRRESMFLGLAVGLNLPLITGFTVTAALQADNNGHNVQMVLAFEFLVSTTIVLVVMFLPRSRQLSAMGESGLYTEDVAVVKPISELTVHKLYYPVYEDQQCRPSSSSSAVAVPVSVPIRRTDFTFANDEMDNDDDDIEVDVSRTNTPANEGDLVASRHWYPPLRSASLATLGYGPSSSGTRNYRYSTSPSHLDHYTGIRRSSQVANGAGCGRCLTPPSEEGSDDVSTSSVHDGNGRGDFHEHNVNGVSYTSVHVNGIVRQSVVY